jgi:hypothetical protein
MTFRRVLLVVLFAGFEFAKLAVPGYAAPPRTVTVAGDDLVLNGIATRQALVFDLYTVALYLPEPTTSVERISDPSVPKAFYVEVDYDGSAPDVIPEHWREELLPPVSVERPEELRHASQSLGEGDAIHIAYVPGAGAAVQLNGETVLRDTGHGLIEAVIDLWIGADPVSEDVRRGLLYGGT